MLGELTVEIKFAKRKGRNQNMNGALFSENNIYYDNGKTYPILLLELKEMERPKRNTIQTIH